VIKGEVMEIWQWRTMLGEESPVWQKRALGRRGEDEGVHRWRRREEKERLEGVRLLVIDLIMNVLVLNGPGVSPAALRHTLASLRALLFPYYAVQTVSPDVLASNAWVHTCALLVFTGGRDMLYLSSLANSNANIINYVRHGGSFLGFCAGAYYASDSIEWELGRDSYEVKGTRPLKFFPGISRGCVYPGFAYDSDDGARIVKLTRPDGKAYDGLYYNGGGEFVDAEKHPGVTVAANYDTDSGADKAAGVVCKVGHGKASLWGVHLEYSLLLEPLRGMLQGVSHDTALQWEKERTALLQDELQSLGLRIPERSRSIYAHPLPQYLIASPHLVGLVNSTVAKLSPNHSAQSSWVLKDTHDTFHFHGGTAGFGSSAMRSQPNENAIEPELDGPKHIIFYDHGLPSPSETPLFSLPLFFSSLQEARSRRYLTKTTCDQWGVGELLLYGEAVTSTHSLVEQ
jgi:biotin--protein ligase